ncbi:cell division protein FtsW [Lysobacter daejeonensis GH1-9]|uniref:Probable peptidoglycan glycosyltransferase FtsW n=1 Tax=Lysobacter daejeonensis GH1-9 TaxID=1385517 RepID=A0A0A0ETL8_9GAMM|nr:putative lipid II flippase FtsW [Lysobacter daejeonensis]KGM53839.1 cell division protein FtsW [Lysobacter daejeonensis GH1-9]
MDAVARQATRYDAIQGRFDPWLLGIALALVCLGVVMVGSASVAIAEVEGSSPYYYLIRHSVFICGGLVLAAWIARTELKTIEQHSWWLLLACFVLLLLVFVPGIGKTVNGARRWLNLGIAGFQAVEAVKLCFIIWMASYLKRFSEEVSATWPAMLKPLGVAVALVVILLMQPDFGSSSLLLAITAGMLVLGGVNMPRMFAPVLIGLPMLAVIAIAEPYRMRRITSFTNPFDDPFGAGYQLANALMAVGRGEWLGVGLGASVQKLSYLPEAHTDFIMAVIAEEFGFLGVVLVVGLFTAFVGRAFWVGYKCVEMRRHFAGYCAFGIGLWIGLQALVSIGVNLGLLPTKGLTLPLISYGGSSVMMTCVAVGLLLRVSYELDRAQRQVALRRGESAAATSGRSAYIPPTAQPLPSMASAARVAVSKGADATRGTSRLRQRIEPILGRGA